MSIINVYTTAQIQNNSGLDLDELFRKIPSHLIYDTYIKDSSIESIILPVNEETLDYIKGSGFITNGDETDILYNEIQNLEIIMA